MTGNPNNIDELLTGFIDGELPERQQTEVKRMISHDPQVARRLRRLENCRTLINSLPPAEAPAEILARIRHTLERKTPLTQQPVMVGSGKGARHLFMRRLVAAAAMIGLFAGLCTVIYTIIAPVPAEGPGLRPVARESQLSPRILPGIEPAAPPQTAGELWGRLELKTDAVAAVGAFINRAIEDNGLADCLETTVLPDKKLFALTCDKELLSPLIADLAGIWHRFGSATLSLETGQFGRPVVVGSVTAQQTAQIIGFAGQPKCVEVARDFAVLNSVAESTSDMVQLARAGHTPDTGLTVVPKPVLTGGPKPVKKVLVGSQEAKVNLTIVLLGRE